MNFDKYEIAYREKIIQRNKYWHYTIALHFFENKDVKWQEWFEYFEDFCATLGIKLTKAITRGPNYGNSYHFKSYKSIKNKLTEHSFIGIESLSALTPIIEPGEPLDLSRAIINHSIYAPQYKSSAEAIFSIEENTLAFSLERYLQIAKKMYECTQAAYGYIFRWPLLGSPGIYVMGEDNFSLDEDEVKRVYKWWRFCSDENQNLFPTMLRDIFKVNLLSQSHLDVKLQNGQTLRQWICANPSDRGTLGNITDDFYYWYIEDESLIPTIREELSQSGIIVCA